jgi:hypothetical protein
MHAFSRFRLAALGLVVFSVLLAMPGGALAAKPTFHDNFTDTITDNNICGVDGTSTIRVNNVVTLTDTSFKTTGSYTEVFVADDGRTATLHTGGQATGHFVDNGDNTTTFYNTWKGLPEQIRGGGGGVATRDAGLLTLVQVVDFSDPANPVLISSEFTAEHGPHPEADADFAIFCDAFLTALG